MGVTINNTADVLVISEEKQRELQETRRKMLEAEHKYSIQDGKAAERPEGGSG